MADLHLLCPIHGREPYIGLDEQTHLLDRRRRMGAVQHDVRFVHVISVAKCLP